MNQVYGADGLGLGILITALGVAVIAVALLLSGGVPCGI